MIHDWRRTNGPWNTTNNRFVSNEYFILFKTQLKYYWQKISYITNYCYGILKYSNFRRIWSVLCSLQCSSVPMFHMVGLEYIEWRCTNGIWDYEGARLYKVIEMVNPAHTIHQLMLEFQSVKRKDFFYKTLFLTLKLYDPVFVFYTYQNPYY